MYKTGTLSIKIVSKVADSESKRLSVQIQKQIKDTIMKKNRENSGAERCWSPHIYQEIAGYSTRRQHNSASGSSKGKK